MKVFVDWPDYGKNSNGIACLYELSLHLANIGFEVYGVPRRPRSFFRHIHSLPKEYASIPIDIAPMGSQKDIMIVAETISPRQVCNLRSQKIRVVWWQLAPYQLLGSRALPEIGDLNLPFSSYVDPHAKKFFYYQPALDCSWNAALTQGTYARGKESLQICIYNGKGRLKSLAPSVLKLCGEAEIVVITRGLPSTRSELIRLLQESHGLISYDEFSAINLEAASLGVPVFLANSLFPSLCRKNFPIKGIDSMVLEDEDKFIRLVTQRMSVGLPLWNPTELTMANSSFLASFEILLRDPGQAIESVVTHESLASFRSYSSFLKAKRVISIHCGGQAGSKWLYPCFASLISAGKQYKIVFIAALVLEKLYEFAGPILLALEKMPAFAARRVPCLRKVINYSDLPLLSYMAGQKICRR